MDNVDTLVDIEDEILGEEVQCPYCCDRGDHHHEARMRDLDYVLEAAAKIGDPEMLITENIAKEMSDDLYFFRTGEERTTV
jgi:hypothetical protein